MIILCSVLIWGNITTAPFQIEWFLYAQTLAYFLTFLICITIVMAKASFYKPTWNIPFFIMILKQSFPFALLILLMTFYNRIDSVMLERILDNGSYYTGLYAAAYRLLDAFNMIAYLVAVILLPFFSRMLKNNESVVPIVKISATMLFVFSTFIAMFSAIYSQEIISLLYYNCSKDSADILKILMFCFVPVSITYVFGTLLTANGSLKYLNIIALSGMLLNVILNFILIPHYKAIGAASVSLATQTLTAAFQIIFVVIIFKLKPDYTFLLKLLVHLIIMCGIIISAYFMIDNMYIVLLISLAVTLISSISLRILKPIRFVKLLFEKTE
jgi:O-antigen/teichoic acid export membrane protein